MSRLTPLTLMCYVWLVGDPRLQIMTGLLVLFVATILHARFLPFANMEMNKFEFVSLMVSSMTFYLGIFTIDAGDSGDKFAFASAVAIVVNGSYLLVVVYTGRYVLQDGQNEALKKEMAPMTISDVSAHGNDVRAEAGQAQEDQDLVSVDVGSVEMTTTASAPTPAPEEARKVRKAPPVGAELLIARASYEARKPTQMSFSKGDVIKKVQDKNDHWSYGKLLQSQTYPVPSKSLSYPNSYFKPYPGKTSPRKPRLDQKTAPSGAKVMVQAKAKFEAKKSNRMSFGKGDQIEILDPTSTSNWKRGILRVSATCEITGEVKLVPANYVKEVTSRGIVRMDTAKMLTMI